MFLKSDLKERLKEKRPFVSGEDFNVPDEDEDNLNKILQERPGQKRPADQSASEYQLESTRNQGGASFNSVEGSLTPIDTPVPEDTIDIAGSSSLEHNAQQIPSQLSTQLETPSTSGGIEPMVLGSSDTTMSSTAAVSGGGQTSGQQPIPFRLGFQEPVAVPHKEGIGFDLITENNVRMTTPAWNFLAVVNPYTNLGDQGAIFNLGAGKDFLYQPMGQEIPYDSLIPYFPPSVLYNLPTQTHTCKIKWVEVVAIPTSTQVFYNTGSTDTGPVTSMYDMNLFKVVGGNHAPVMWSRMAIQGAVSSQEPMTPVETNYEPVDYTRLKERFWGPAEVTQTGGVTVNKYLCHNIRRELESVGGYWYDRGGTLTHTKGVNLLMERRKTVKSYGEVAGKPFLVHRYEPVNGMISSPWIKGNVYPNGPRTNSWSNSEQRMYSEALKGEVALMLQYAGTNAACIPVDRTLTDDTNTYIASEMSSIDLRSDMYGKDTAQVPLSGFTDMYGNWVFGLVDSDLPSRKLVYNYYPFRTKHMAPIKAWSLADRDVGTGANLKHYHYKESLSLQSYHSKIERADSFLPVGSPDNDTYPKAAPVPPSLIIGMEAIQQKDFRTNQTKWMAAATTWGISFKMCIECTYKYPDPMFTEPNFKTPYIEYNTEGPEQEILRFVVRKAVYAENSSTQELDVTYQIQDMQPPELMDFSFNGHVPKTQKTGMSIIPGDPKFYYISAQSAMTDVPTVLNKAFV